MFEGSGIVLGKNGVESTKAVGPLSADRSCWAALLRLGRQSGRRPAWAHYSTVFTSDTGLCAYITHRALNILKLVDYVRY